MLIGIGAILSLAASPAVAERIGLEPFHFVRRQFFFLMPSVAILISVSILSPRAIRRLASIVFIVAAGLLVLTLLVGPEIKGARRWIALGSLSIQASEFIKPAFAVVSAWMFAEQCKGEGFPGKAAAVVLYATVVTLLLLQPDLGMAVVVSAVWFTQFFLAGLPMLWVIALGLAGLGGLVGAYLVFPHVASRVDRFLDPSSGDSYQVEKAIEAFMNGGVFGRGPGEGTVKEVLPDAHTDFVFAVAGEELGLAACLLIVALFAFIVLRGFGRLMQERSLFVLIAASGILVQFGTQAIINMASSLRMMPTKGMTLPFISYGGSSLLGLGLGMGMVLALTRHRPTSEDNL
jgi:cell division protein FtsW